MARKTISIDLTEVNNFVYHMQNAPSTVMSLAMEASNEWAVEAEAEYANRIPYANGFKRSKDPKGRSSSTFHSVYRNSNTNFSVGVGHEWYIAKFLEVGTKPHNIRRGENGVIRHPGMPGTKALQKAVNANKKNLPTKIEKKLDDNFNDIT
jgi:hypothetical protein